MDSIEAQTVESLIDSVLRREGGFVDHPDDRGGATRFGISEAVARAAGYDGPMARLPEALARRLYRERYWQAPGLDRIAAAAPRTAAEMFDTGVNMGPASAARFLQRALNALNRAGRDYGDIAVDGEAGPMTRAALDAFIRTRGPQGDTVLAKALNALQGARYIELAEARQANESFVFGWLDQRL